MPTTTLAISRLINVQVNLTPQAAQAQNLNTLLIFGSSTVIDVVSRMRLYNTLTAVAADFGTSAPEYLAATLWFGQVPQPTTLFIGRWAQTASSGQLIGTTLPTSVLTTLQGIANGSFKITVDGGAQQSLTALNFTAITNLNGAASIINAVLTGAVVTYNSVFNRLEVRSNSTGAASVISFAVTGASGTDISATLGLTVGSSGAYQANGIAAETAVSAVTLLDSTFGQQWYAVTVLSAADADHQSISAYIEGTTTFHYYGVSTQEAGALSSASTTDIAYLLSQTAPKRTGVQYSSTSPYSIVSLLARILTVDYTQQNSTITLKFKNEPGVIAETINATQIVALEAKNCNVFVAYSNNTSILEQGVSSSGDFIDTVIGSHVLAATIQNNVYNALLTVPTKISQTDAGMNILVTAASAACSQFAFNGWIAPGLWTQQGFGQLQTNQQLPTGFYVFADKVANQNQANRSARIAVPLQIAVKLAGAIHSASVTVTVNS